MLSVPRGAGPVAGPGESGSSVGLGARRAAGQPRGGGFWVMPCALRTRRMKRSGGSGYCVSCGEAVTSPRRQAGVEIPIDAR